jgi:hypothetical protein
MKRNSNQLTKADYDFSEVASGLELEGCLFYEYARESSAAIREVVAARKQIALRKGKAGEVKFSSHHCHPVQGHNVC